MEINYNKLAKAITRCGVILLKSGAEIHRVEDTMERICYAYGAKTVDSYATPGMLIISFSFEDDSILYHNIKRVHGSEINLNKIDEINALSRSLNKKLLSVEELNKQLDKIDNHKTYNNPILYLGALICSIGFAIYFNGTFLDIAFSAVMGLLMKIMLTKLEKIQVSSFIKNVFGGLFLVTITHIASLFFNINKNIVSMSVIMLLVPGLAITNAIKDGVNGDAISSLSRMIEAIVVAIAIALGSLLGLYIQGILQ